MVSPRLGTHTSIIHFHVANSFRRRYPTIHEYNKGLQPVSDQVLVTASSFTFFHEINRPFGNPQPYQCPGCKCVRPWGRIFSKLEESKFACQNCNHTIAYNKPNGTQIILYSQGFCGTSSVSSKLVRKGRNAAGSGWLMSVTIEPAAPLRDTYLAACLRTTDD